HLREPVDLIKCQLLLLAEDFLERFEFKLAQFAVGKDEKVAAAAGGVEERELAEFGVEFFEPRLASGGAVSLAVFKLGPEFVEEQRTDDFENVALRSVVHPKLPALLLVLIPNVLKQRAEDGG